MIPKIVDILQNLHTRMSDLESLRFHRLGLNVYDDAGNQILFPRKIEFQGDDEELNLPVLHKWLGNVNLATILKIVRDHIPSPYKLVKLLGYNGSQRGKIIYFDGEVRNMDKNLNYQNFIAVLDKKRA